MRLSTLFFFSFACIASVHALVVQNNITVDTAASQWHAFADEVVPQAPSSWAHPGVMINRAQLGFVKNKVAVGAQPWSSAYRAMLDHELASPTRNPKPTATVECGPTSTPNKGCTEERQDALAAYANALAYYFSGEASYATKAISYMNAWAHTIKAHTNSNAKLQTGWAGASWARAAEIVRHTYSGWRAADISAFEGMLRNVYLPVVIKGSNSNGNWELVMLEAAVGISVFLEDSASYNTAMQKFMGRVPAYVYLQKDGAYPKAAPGSGLDTKDKIISYWQGQPTFLANGISQETCRDFTHTGAFPPYLHIAETSRIQGNDLYTGDVGERLRYALGFHAQFEMGASKPDWLCPNRNLNKGLGPITEVGFNAMHNRLGYGMTNTENLAKQTRPAGSNYLFMGWETLTHGDNTA
ncbi:chondroitin AC/alginate lyase [Cylindrobasidium torrendii FP15055 ss-10]|uniref:Chondroitin AC/alginate lyase n=1 Tax=Cylindrobasidium torrendii FP15055 ss-10 TaxID=1314674 RepID=A0A0D7BES7_9AGAR|nr:chondroitin AC/alginate lyase [Cylindrobasidium torrendii FP15055 ss-10]